MFLFSYFDTTEHETHQYQVHLCAAVCARNGQLGVETLPVHVEDTGEGWQQLVSLFPSLAAWWHCHCLHWQQQLVSSLVVWSSSSTLAVLAAAAAASVVVIVHAGGVGCCCWCGCRPPC
jgi:hypothetical protein